VNVLTETISGLKVRYSTDWKAENRRLSHAGDLEAIRRAADEIVWKLQWVRDRIGELQEEREKAAIIARRAALPPLPKLTRPVFKPRKARSTTHALPKTAKYVPEEDTVEEEEPEIFNKQSKSGPQADGKDGVKRQGKKLLSEGTEGDQFELRNKQGKSGSQDTGMDQVKHRRLTRGKRSAQMMSTDYTDEDTQVEVPNKKLKTSAEEYGSQAQASKQHSRQAPTQEAGDRGHRWRGHDSCSHQTKQERCRVRHQG
jgi:hypothetical protein